MSDMSLAPLHSTQSGVMRTYRRLVDQGTIEADAVQSDAAMALDRLAQALQSRHEEKSGILARFTKRRPAPLKGIYLVGQVGRGKTMLMDLFCREVGLAKKRRIHFHVFMQEVLRALHKGQSQGDRKQDPVRELAQKVHEQNDLLCFDEFQINDMSDAVLVLRLLDMVMELGTVVVATSNTAPPDLMKHQPQNRMTMRPFLEAFAAHITVLTLDSARDYRRGRELDKQTWLVPDSEENRAHLRQKFETLTEAQAKPGFVAIGSRRIAVLACHGETAWFTFNSLCGEALGPADYLAIAKRFRTLFIEGVPALVPDQYDKARRFITLIDVMYENHTALFATAAAEPEALYQTGENATAFERTASRLDEMRSNGWVHEVEG
ncbi:cell division protein ZapE [Asaia lannensis]|uniref:Cell division protein ZapE n=1 Tax=Asaia lannensis NBRC 102526 TaxID=1307926 RepID=A0ABT1CD23_9PROT|nr:cell division protein ZapE [Asaia lannensis]MCO6158763.1 cell division protein ZapE [Asaia lannensis NBRC 102526]